MTEPEDRELLNPYEQRARRRIGPRLSGDATLRRRTAVAVALLVAVALVGGTVGTSCAPVTTAVSGPAVPAR